MSLTWTYKSFNELHTLELYAILQLRAAVFVVEQNCVYQDVDGKDKVSFHVMAWQGDELMAYARLVPPGVSFDEASIGRVITAPQYRGKGAGITLIEKSIAQVRQSYHTTTIRISAQYYLKKFYAAFGFKPCGDTYLEDGIPHIEMVLVDE